MPPAKRVAAVVNIQLDAGAAQMGKAGQALGPHGVNIVEVVRAYNTATEHQRGEIVPAVITIYEDRSFTLATKTPPTSALLRTAAGLAKGSSRPHDAPGHPDPGPAPRGGPAEAARPEHRRPRRGREDGRRHRPLHGHRHHRLRYPRC